jgi:hypothetical protein
MNLTGTDMVEYYLDDRMKHYYESPTCLRCLKHMGYVFYPNKDLLDYHFKIRKEYLKKVEFDPLTQKAITKNPFLVDHDGDNYQPDEYYC